MHVFRNFRPRAASVHVLFPRAKIPKPFALVPLGHPRVAAPFCNPTTVTFGGVRDGGFWLVLTWFGPETTKLIEVCIGVQWCAKVSQLSETYLLLRLTGICFKGLAFDFVHQVDKSCRKTLQQKQKEPGPKFYHQIAWRLFPNAEVLKNPLAPAEELSPRFRRYSTIKSTPNTKYSSTGFDAVEESMG